MLVNAASAVRRRVRQVAQKALFEHIVSSVGRRGPIEDDSALFNYVARGNWGIISPIQSRGELTPVLAEVRRRRPRTVMEIGTANGGTLFALTRVAAPDATIISLDLPGGDWGGGYGEDRVPLYEAFALPQQKLHLLRTDSHTQEALARVRDILAGRTLDYLFIDGDHTYEGVRQDYDMYSPLVAPGGLIGFHDIVYAEGVKRIWQEMKAEVPGGREYISPSEPIYGIGLIEKAA